MNLESAAWKPKEDITHAPMGFSNLPGVESKDRHGRRHTKWADAKRREFARQPDNNWRREYLCGIICNS